jgi:hypothetical protein
MSECNSDWWKREREREREREKSSFCTFAKRWFSERPVSLLLMRALPRPDLFLLDLVIFRCQSQTEVKSNSTKNKSMMYRKNDWDAKKIEIRWTKNGYSVRRRGFSAKGGEDN